MERYISFSLGNLRLIDSYHFLSSSLESLTENVKATGGISNVKHFQREFKSARIANLLLRKNVFPKNNESRFSETEFPPKEAFYSHIKKRIYQMKIYRHACNVHQTQGVKNLDGYSDLYLKTGVLLLADIFKNFRAISLRDYKLDPCYFYSASRLSWAAMLLMTKVKLTFLTQTKQLSV